MQFILHERTCPLTLHLPIQDSVPYIKKGDVIGCALDLTVPIITFYVNGRQVNGAFTGFNLDGMFFPVVSASAKLRCVPVAYLEVYT